MGSAAASSYLQPISLVLPPSIGIKVLAESKEKALDVGLQVLSGHLFQGNEGWHRVVTDTQWLLQDKVHEVGIQQMILECRVDVDADSAARQLSPESCGQGEDTAQQTLGRASTPLLQTAQQCPWVWVWLSDILGSSSLLGSHKKGGKENISSMTGNSQFT